jgi:CMP-N-acetylneuraminic acid synthetase
MKLIIPARKGSKGFPLKNRKLMDATLGIIPQDYRKDCIISTDDEYIIDTYKHEGTLIHNRPNELCTDESSMLDVLLNISNTYSFSKNETILVLYLTYPQRDWLDIISIFHFFEKNNLDSLLCRKDIITNPYLCMYELPNNKGKQIIEHNLYCRQDYPKMFEISHYMVAIKNYELPFLNKNLYNTNTYFYPIDQNTIDVDYEKDYLKFIENR